ncbi:MAG: homoaconitate hydratase [Sulfolobaceae archaeon]
MLPNTPWFSNAWFVSQYNYEVLKSLEVPEKVSVHDTTLRDGEQQPGLVFRKEEKFKIALALDEAGVDFIEAGMPAVSSEDFEAIKEIARQGLQAKVMAFVRCLKEDVELALKTEVPGLVMELPSSEHIIRYAYKWSIEKALTRAREALEYAKQHGLYVKFFTIDATRSDMGFLRKVIENIHDFMDVLVVADTFGVMHPLAIGYFIEKLKEFVKKPIEIHAHNDFGLAVANSIFAIIKGASGVQVTVNGIGERSGNASLEETILALELLLGIKTGIKLEKLYSLSKLVEKYSGVPLPPNKPVVGDNVTRIESGIIADWWLNVKDVRPVEMLPYLPSLVGRNQNITLLLGKKSGKGTIIEKLKEMNLMYDEILVARILDEVKKEAIIRKRPLTDDEFKEIITRVLK